MAAASVIAAALLNCFFIFSFLSFYFYAAAAGNPEISGLADSYRIIYINLTSMENFSQSNIFGSLLNFF